MDEQRPPRRLDDEGSTELKRILFGFQALALPGEEVLGALEPHGWTRNLPQGATLHLERSVRLLGVVNQEREIDVELFLECGSCLGPPHPDSRDRGTGLFDLVLPVTQLRDTLTAERSAVVA